LNRLFLLADDDQDDAELFGEVLQGLDPPIHFQHVSDGRAVFNFLSSNSNPRPDIIFLDLNMPEMSGWQCLAKLKNDTHLREIPVIMYSTSANPRDREIAGELGAVGFVTKPTDFKLLTKILAALSRSSSENLKSALKPPFAW
jgi:CheY-like chemotaxis protein